MTLFRYTALGPGEEKLSGIMDAASEEEVIERLRRRGTIPIRAELAPSGASRVETASWPQRLFPQRHLSRSDVCNLFREMATMLSAGQDLDRSLRYALRSARRRRVRKVLQGLHDQVRGGSPLSSAMARYAGTFAPLHVALVKAGEARGDLAGALSRLAEIEERWRSLKANLTSALIYPSILVVAMIGAVALLLIEVLPEFVPMFEQNGVQPPEAIRFLLSLGNVVQQEGVLILVALLAMCLTISVALRQNSVKLVVDRVLIRLPLVGSLLKEIMAALFTRILGSLLSGGVALLPALSITRDALDNRAARQAVDRASQTARSGGGLTDELEAARIFPARTIDLLRLGEETAQLPAIALRAADIHDETARAMSQRLLALLVPVLTILIGLIVGGIVGSLMSAMVSINDIVSG